MNKLIFGLLFFVSLSSFAQDTTSTASTKPPLYYLYQNSYNLALKYNDPLTARSALYTMINMDPLNDSLRVTLAFSYFEARQYPSTILTCLDVLGLNPQNPAALEMSGIAYEELGIKDKALSSFEKLYMVNENVNTLYKLTFIQYDLERYNECEVNIDILLKDENIDNETLRFQFGEDEQKDYSMRVAVLNLSGLVKKAQGDKDGARAAFNQALEIAPDFAFAKTNLEELDK